MAASITFNTKALERAMKALPKVTRKSLRFRLDKIGDEFERRMDKRFTAVLSGEFRANNTKNKLANRTGTLRATMAHKVRDVGKDLTLRNTIGSAATRHYVHIQEKGGIIKPKRARALTIPLPDNLTAAGRPRFQKASEVEGLFLLKLNGKAFLVRKAPSGEGLEFLWILKSSVKIPARLGFVRTWRSKSMQSFAREELNAGVLKALKRAGLK